MVAIYKTLDGETGDIDLQGRIVLPFLWLWCHFTMGNLYIFEKLEDFLKRDDRTTSNMMAEYLSKLGRGWKSLNDMGFPRVGMYELETGRLYDLKANDGTFTFKKAIKDDPEHYNFLTIYDPMYHINQDKQFVLSPHVVDSLDERSQNILTFNHFIRNRYPIKLRKYNPVGGEIQTPVPYEPEES